MPECMSLHLLRRFSHRKNNTSVLCKSKLTQEMIGASNQQPTKTIIPRSKLGKELTSHQNNGYFWFVLSEIRLINNTNMRPPI